MRTATVLLLALALAGAASAADELIVTELMYNSINDANGDDVEWIELYNAGGAALDLTGWTLTDDDATHDPMTLSGTMAPGEVMLVVGDEAQFNLQYPGVSNYFPVFFLASWALGNGGDGVQIFDGAGNVVFAFAFDDASPWPEACDGDGPSLLLMNTGCADFSDAGCWTTGEDWGTPGVLTQTVGDEETSFGALKAMFR